jgi:hypothetical protein
MANADLDRLLNTMLPFAQQMLAKHGEFFPFGSSMTAEGEISINAADTGDEQPPSQQLIDLLTKAYQKQAEARQLRAAGICYDARVVPPGETEKSDAVCACLEHQSGEAADVYVPYRKGCFGRIRYGKLFGAQRTPQFFVQHRA